MLSLRGLDALLSTLRHAGYRLIGPTVRDGALMLDEISSVDELPAGIGVRLSPGGYRLRQRPDDALFAPSAGPQPWKGFLHPPRLRLWSARRNGDDFLVEDGTLDGGTADPEAVNSELADLEVSPDEPGNGTATRGGVSSGGMSPRPAPLAFLGVRPCDLHAIGILDWVLTGGQYRDTGGSVRECTRSRYRQWLTRNLDT